MVESVEARTVSRSAGPRSAGPPGADRAIGAEVDSTSCWPRLPPRWFEWLWSFATACGPRTRGPADKRSRTLSRDPRNSQTCSSSIPCRRPLRAEMAGAQPGVHPRGGRLTRDRHRVQHRALRDRGRRRCSGRCRSSGPTAWSTSTPAAATATPTPPAPTPTSSISRRRTRSSRACRPTARPSRRSKAGDQSRMALGEVVTGNYFQVLGVSAALGRTLLPEDDRPGAPRAVVLSNRAWMRDLRQRPVGARPDAAHSRPALHHRRRRRRAFTGMVPMLQPEMWLPLAWVEEVEPAGIQDSVPSPTGNTRLERRGQRWLFVKGRLKDGETVGACAGEPAGHHAAARGHASEDEREAARVASPRTSGSIPQADAMLRPIARR